MLQRALASLLCLLGIAAIALGIASATLWRPADTLVASLRVDEGIVLTDPGVLEMAASTVTVSARAVTGDVVLAIGRSQDVTAWVGQDAAVRITGLESRTRLSGTDEAVEPTPTPSVSPDVDTATPAPEESAEPEEATEEEAAADALPPDPSGSDLWVQEATGTPTAQLAWTQEPGRWSAVAVATGGGPVTLELTWPQVVTTPWRLPGILVGSVLLLAGLVWWGVLLLRRYRPEALLGVAALAAQQRATLFGARDRALADADTPVAQVPGASDEPSAGSEPDAPVGTRRARRLQTGSQPVVVEPGPADEGPDGPHPSDLDSQVESAGVDNPGVEASGVGVEPVPLTRRALREQRERAERERAAGHGRTERGSEEPVESSAVPDASSTGDSAAAATAPGDEDDSHATEPDVEASTPADDAPVVTEPAPKRWPFAGRTRSVESTGDAEPAQDAEPGQAAEPAQDVEPARDVEPAQDVEPGQAAEGGQEAAPRTWRSVFGRRRTEEPPVQPPAEPDEVARIGTVEVPVVPAPSASADAWRRAWGLPATATSGTVWTPPEPPVVPGAAPDEVAADQQDDGAPQDGESSSTSQEEER